MCQVDRPFYQIDAIVLGSSMNHVDAVIFVGNVFDWTIFFNNSDEISCNSLYCSCASFELNDENVKNVAVIKKVNRVIEKHVISSLKFKEISTEQSISCEFDNNCILER